MNNSVIRNKLTKKISSLSFDKEDLRKMLNLLQLRANAESEIEYKKLQAKNLDNDTIEEVKTQLNDCAVLRVTVTSSESLELFGTIEEVFSSISFPDSLKSIYLNSDFIYRYVYNYYPENSFQLLLDFSKPKIFDFSFQPSDKTPNDSEFSVQGSDSTWVNGVFHEINAFIETKPSKYSKSHKGSIYDFLVWFIGIPIGFWVCNKITFQNLILFKNYSFAQNIFLTYCFFLILLITRILFHYIRWMYPMIEYKGKKERSIAHQTAIISIGLGIIGKLLYDFIRFILNLS